MEVRPHRRPEPGIRARNRILASEVRMTPCRRSSTCIARRGRGESAPMASPTVDDHFEIVTSTAYWMAKQLPFRVPRAPLIQVGSAALAQALRSHDPNGDVGLETWCRQQVRRAIRDFITDRFEA